MPFLPEHINDCLNDLRVGYAAVLRAFELEEVGLHQHLALEFRPEQLECLSHELSDLLVALHPSEQYHRSEPL